MTEASIIAHPNSEKCAVCRTTESDPLKLGEKYQLRSLIWHEHCVLSSKKATQKAKDKKKEVKNHFAYADIRRTIGRVKSKRCEYCNELGAASHCHECKKDFHLPCGLKAGSLSIYKGNFPSFCHEHRPRQIIPADVLREAQLTPPICSPCMEPVSVDGDDLKLNAMWAPCCRKNWYHRDCVQSMANHMGSLLKCAVCNNKVKFRNWMAKHGIYVRNREASWESDESAYDILNIRHHRCDVPICRSPYGRTDDRPATRWEIVLCRLCGAQGAHVSCAGLKYLDSEWECPDCRPFSRNPYDDYLNNITPRLANNCVSHMEVNVVSDSDSDSDIEILSTSSDSIHVIQVD